MTISPSRLPGAAARRLALALMVLVVLAGGALTLAADPARSAGTVTCAVIEAGEAGTKGDLLDIYDSRFGTIIVRDGDEIDVLGFNNPREPVTCLNGPATVTNIDGIRYTGTGAAAHLFIDQSADFAQSGTGGVFGPGRTPERGGGAEIEIYVNGESPGVTYFGLDDQGDQIDIGNLPPRTTFSTGINGNFGEDGRRPDIDVYISGDRTETEIRVLPRGGDDLVRGTVSYGRFDPLTILRFRVAGAAGNDRIIGSPGRDLLVAGNGSDRIRAGGGRDDVKLGAGHDRGYGGPGPDRVEIYTNEVGPPNDTAADLLDGGAGNDRLYSVLNGFADTVRCGSGKDSAAVDFVDRRRGCERKQVL